MLGFIIFHGFEELKKDVGVNLLFDRKFPRVTWADTLPQARVDIFERLLNMERNNWEDVNPFECETFI